MKFNAMTHCLLPLLILVTATFLFLSHPAYLPHSRPKRNANPNPASKDIFRHDSLSVRSDGLGVGAIAERSAAERDIAEAAAAEADVNWPPARGTPGVTYLPQPIYPHHLLLSPFPSCYVPRHFYVISFPPCNKGSKGEREMMI